MGTDPAGNKQYVVADDRIAPARGAISSKAIADYSEAIRLSPKYIQAYYNRGISYRKKGEFDKAIADYTEAIRLDPKEPDAYFNRGGAYEKKGDMEKAIADFDESCRLNPSRPGAVRIKTYRRPYIPFKSMPWLTPVCVLILLAAAFLHWRRTRRLVSANTGDRFVSGCLGAIAADR